MIIELMRIAFFGALFILAVGVLLASLVGALEKPLSPCGHRGATWSHTRGEYCCPTCGAVVPDPEVQ